MGGYTIPLYIVPFGLAYLLIQSIGLRHQRALMVLIALEQEMQEASVESGLQQPLYSQQPPVVSYESEEQQPFLSYNQQPLSEEEEMQHIMAIIDAQASAPVQPVPVPAPAGYTSAMPQYPFAFPPQQQDQQPFVFVPYQVPASATEHQAYYPSPMMYPGMPLPQPYPAMMVMMPPPDKQ